MGAGSPVNSAQRLLQLKRVILPDGTLFGAHRNFAFTAVRHSDGTVSGESELITRLNGFRAHAEIICFTVIGNQAWKEE
jgi:hypothetical protein